MGRCPYVDESASFLDGWHCIILGGHVDDYDIVRNYCTSSVHCKKCPYHPDGRKTVCDTEDDHSDLPEEEVIFSSSTSKRKSAPSPSHDTRKYDIGTTTGSYRSYRSRRNTAVALAVVAFLLAAVIFGGKLIGILGPWVDMQTAQDTRSQRAYLLTVSREQDSGTLFKSRASAFDEEGYVHASAFSGLSDVYFKQDKACVWLGTTHLYVLNTAAVYDLSDSEIKQQLYRPLLVTAVDIGGAAVSSALTVTDESGQAVRCIPTGEGSYTLLLPDEAVHPVLTFHADGYQTLTAAPDLSGRMAQIVITLTAQGGAER